MFLSTLGLREWMVQNWVTGSREDGSEDVENYAPLENGMDTPPTNTKERKVSEKKIKFDCMIDKGFI